MIFFCSMSEHCSFPGLNASHRQCVAVICVSFPSDVQAFPAAFLLDPANAIDPGTGRVIPPWGSLNEEDTAAVKIWCGAWHPEGSSRQRLRSSSSSYLQAMPTRTLPGQQWCAFSRVTAVCHRCVVLPDVT